MDTKFCKHCGKEIEFEFKREKVTKTKVSGGVVTYTGETELVKKYNSAICSKCGGTFCMDCIESECRDKYRNIVVKNLCPTCYNPDLADCTHVSSKYNYIGTTEENGEEFIVHEKTCNKCGKSETIKIRPSECTHVSSKYIYMGTTEENGEEFIVHEKICDICGKAETIKVKIDECNHIFGNKQLVRYDNNFNYYEKTCTVCGEVKGFAEPLDKAYEPKKERSPNTEKGTVFEVKPNAKPKKSKVPRVKTKPYKPKNKGKSFGSRTNKYKKKSSSKNNDFIKFFTHNPILVIVIIIAIFGFLDSSDYIHYDIMDYEYRAETLPFTGAASSSLSLDNYPNTTDPTYNQLIQFIMNDKTDTIIYDFGSFVCADYAVMVHNNAEMNGIKAGVVDLSFSDRSDGHALNVFNTTDKGLVFIDCTGTEDNYGKNNADKIVKLEKGEPYVPKPIFTSRMYYEDIGIVKDYDIYW
jgi:hypothetical protein